MKKNTLVKGMLKMVAVFAIMLLGIGIPYAAILMMVAGASDMRLVSLAAASLPTGIYTLWLVKFHKKQAIFLLDKVVLKSLKIIKTPKDMMKFGFIGYTVPFLLLGLTESTVYSSMFKGYTAIKGTAAFGIIAGFAMLCTVIGIYLHGKENFLNKVRMVKMFCIGLMQTVCNKADFVIAMLKSIPAVRLSPMMRLPITTIGGRRRAVL